MRYLALAAVLATTGCATVLNESTQTVRIETLTPEGDSVQGAECSAANNKATVTFRSGMAPMVRRSSKDLVVRCSMPGYQEASAHLESGVNSGMFGNIILGGAVGAIVDHNKGTAYTYPTWVQLVFGQLLTFDRHDEVANKPVTPKGAAAVTTPVVPGPAPAAVGSTPPVAPPAPDPPVSEIQRQRPDWRKWGQKDGPTAPAPTPTR